MKLLILLIIFFIFGALLIISNNNLALYSEKNLENFSKLYIKWLDDIFSNVKTITGDVINLRWFPK